ncbi:hypothetical protein DWX43_18910 [Clostridium sp. AF19-22AC]|uniref:hypothetical protein n=1 Tax=Clostridia TaxID=186801 RepID=UPI000E537138|nr:MULTISPECIES: hypothetical protein [Clostridia]RHR24714.1 hypothetical protein DWX43_18910 [Clostridium sp. AF19-22AC]
MLQGIETIFNNKEKMIGHLKKKSYEKNTELFKEENGHFFREMAEYVGQAEDKEKAAEEIGECLVQAVKEHLSNKKGKVEARTQVDLNFFMIYYVFPTILGMECEDPKVIAEGIRRVWGKSFKESDINYTDYDTLYGAFREKIFGIF